PVSADLPSGGTAAFTWTYLAVRGGEVRFAGLAESGDGALSATALSGPVRITEAGETLDDLVVYPTPFKPGGAATLKFRHMPSGSRVRVYTVPGELVVELEGGELGLAEWDGTNAAGSSVAAGVYLCVAEAPDGRRKILKVEVGR
ncbi:MAG: hypothetical protein AAB368_04255, partial [bacterium]